MTLHPIHTGNFKLDGGAMFGVVPKGLWERTNPADEKNLCTWAMRSLLIEDGDRLILIDTGIGNKQNEKFFSHYYLHGDHSLDASLAALGFNRNQITDVFLTHLHFDHVGGAVQWNANRTGYEPAFKNATYWTNERHWNWAIKPNARERSMPSMYSAGRSRITGRFDSFYIMDVIYSFISILRVRLYNRKL